MPEETYPLPLGLTIGPHTSQVSVFAGRASGVDLCLFDSWGNETRLPLAPSGYGVWRAEVEGITPGTEYGFRAAGPHDPSRGWFYNPAKLLLDPYARAITGSVGVHDALRGSNDLDSAAFTPRSVALPATTLPSVHRPRVPWADTVIYELNVRAMTMRHPAIPEKLRGTYAGLAHPAIIDHLTSLGVTTVELMPIHQFFDEAHLLDLGLRNLWGYNSIGFFAPHARYSSSGSHGEQIAEFQAMARTFHEAGIEVLLDVVYNHTAEAGPEGPTLSFRGLDNEAYYRLDPWDRSKYWDVTGCNNTVETRHPRPLQLILDSLRYWAQAMGVDGFRFDLMSALARGAGGVDPYHPLLSSIITDPVLVDLKLIAEPWDATADGYALGRYTAPWAEWNGQFRDSVRDWWRGADTHRGRIATRLAGSSDLFNHDGRLPLDSINYVASHDGFPLADLTAYETKHNDANGEGNRDGDNRNHSCNYGVEGPTPDLEIRRTRHRQIKNMLATLFLSAGVPMITAGDEFGRTQRGNNNAYCQDNTISWLDWIHTTEARDLLATARNLIAFRREHPALRPLTFYSGRPRQGGLHPDLAWFDADGTELTGPGWELVDDPTLMVFVEGSSVGSADLLIVLHAGKDAATITLPQFATSWALALDTTLPAAAATDSAPVSPGTSVGIKPRCVQVYIAEGTV